MRTLIAVSLSLPLLAGCGDMMQNLRGERAGAAPVAESPSATLPVPLAGSPEALDTTTDAERAAALAAPAPTGAAALGSVIVSLGAVAEPGFWLRSSLVSAPGKGRVETAGGQSVAVDLLPGTGSAQLSLAAYRALGLGLTDLVEVRVFAQ
ncbi:hypothetical protein GEU84_003745 [Fertoebacter nigrum]|uniref:D-galactarate dehydratase n=1 Tax=Fertoeibacter niger TaxID=2656921 RepID=A0A8X8H5N6_9RHOB|nr:hypothetical protein [Fertoeibacter niger]